MATHTLFRKDIFGKTFGLWKVLAYARTKTGNDKKALWHCQCSCGEKRIVSGASLRAGKSKSCGCAAIAAGRKVNTKHGKAKTRVHNIWSAMKQRCGNEKHRAFKNYGHRGITVCERWKNSFDCFLEDMGEPGDGESINRIDNSKGYFLGNCEWASRTTQMRNTRGNVLVEFNGKTQTLVEWSIQTGIAYHTLWNRYKEWPNLSDVFTKPVRPRPTRA